METMKKIARDVWSLACVGALAAVITFGFIAGRELACRYVATGDGAARCVERCCCASCDCCADCPKMEICQ